MKQKLIKALWVGLSLFLSNTFTNLHRVQGAECLGNISCNTNIETDYLINKLNESKYKEKKFNYIKNFTSQQKENMVNNIYDPVSKFLKEVIKYHYSLENCNQSPDQNSAKRSRINKQDTEARKDYIFSEEALKNFLHLCLSEEYISDLPDNCAFEMLCGGNILRITDIITSEMKKWVYLEVLNKIKSQDFVQNVKNKISAFIVGLQKKHIALGKIQEDVEIYRKIFDEITIAWEMTVDQKKVSLFINMPFFYDPQVSMADYKSFGDIPKRIIADIKHHIILRFYKVLLSPTIYSYYLSPTNLWDNSIYNSISPDTRKIAINRVTWNYNMAVNLDLKRNYQSKDCELVYNSNVSTNSVECFFTLLNHMNSSFCYKNYEDQKIENFAIKKQLLSYFYTTEYLTNLENTIEKDKKSEKKIIDQHLLQIYYILYGVTFFYHPFQNIAEEHENRLSDINNLTEFKKECLYSCIFSELMFRNMGLSYSRGHYGKEYSIFSKDRFNLKDMWRGYFVKMFDTFTIRNFELYIKLSCVDIKEEYIGRFLSFLYFDQNFSKNTLFAENHNIINKGFMEAKQKFFEELKKIIGGGKNPWV